MANQDQTQSNDVQLNAIARGAENFLRWSSSAMLRGGRVTKFKGVSASYSPELGLVSCGAERDLVAGGESATLTLGLARRLLRWSAAPVALLAAGSPAFAQAQDECVEVTPDNFVCEDNGDPATVTQDLGVLEQDVNVLLQDGFEVDTSGGTGSGISIGEAYDVTISQESGTSTITGRATGISVTGSYGSIDITTGGDVTGINGDGIRADNNAADGIDEYITIDSRAGTVRGGQDGIDVSNFGGGDLSITTADVDGEDGDGINVNNAAGSGDIDIDTTAGTVFGLYGGIVTRNQGDGATTIITADVDTGYGEGGILDGINAVNGTSATDLTIDSSAGGVTGQNNGIFARNNGTGDTTITTGDVDGGRGDGINARSESTSGDLTIDSSAGRVTGQNRGIFARNNGTGDTAITTADVDGEDGNGIDVQNAGRTGNLSVDSSAGTVNGDQSGIRAEKLGVGNVSIVTADVVGNFGDGIDVYRGEGGSGALSIDTSAGTVGATGGDGIAIENVTANSVSITTADVNAVASGSGEGGDGINLNQDFREAETVAVATTGGTITGSNYGINILSRGHDLLSITTADVDGDRDGIRVSAEGPEAGDIDIDTTAGTVTSQNSSGIFVSNNGSGDLTITTADVSGRQINPIGGGYGIFADSTGGSITINSVAGDVSGADDGIFARVDGSGGISITTANVIATGFSGINARLSNTDGDAVIDTSAGAVTGDDDAIVVRNDGSGDTLIITGDVTGISSDGINVSNGTTAGDLTIDSSAGTVTGDSNGILVRNEGTGAVSITTADVSGYSAGIAGVNYGTDFVIDSSAGDVSGQSLGIQARNYGNGDASITTGNVTGTNSDGVYVYNTFTAGSLTIDTSAGAVSGGDDGIEAFHFGFGNLTITTGDVSGSGDDGIFARSNYGDISIDSTAGSVSGARDGIDVAHYDPSFGGYSIAITTADVTAADGDGIRVENEYGSGEISIDSSAGAVTGSNNGIVTYNRGYESPTTITTGDVTGESGSGIVAGTYGVGAYGAGGIAIDSSAGSVTGATYGIEATNNALGDLSITTADVTGQAEAGILARNANGSTGDLTIDSSAGAVSGIYGGIDAQSNGAGSTTITTGDVSSYGEGGDAIEAVNEGENLVIDTTAGRVYTYDATAIRATNNGSGITTITTGEVYAQTGGNAISVSHSGSDVTVNTTAGSVTAGGRNSAGIVVTNSGTGDTTITTGDVSGGYIDGPAPGYAQGIYATNQATSGDLTIDSTSGDVAGESEGIRATNNSAGDTIIRTGNVSGNRIGIVAINTNADAISGDLTIDSSAGFVTGSYRGISVDHYGTGDISVTTADVSATDGDAVNVNDNGEEGAGVDITIDTAQGTVTGSRNGIYAANSGTGDLSITTADVTGTAGDGIEARNLDATTGDLTIDSTAGQVNGFVFGGAGISATNQGSGTTLITTADVFGSSTGIEASIGSQGSDLAIDTSEGTVDGGFYGIVTNNAGTGRQSITTGDVTTYSGDAIVARNTAATATDLIIDTLAGEVTGAGSGISAVNAGTGYTLITTAGVTGASNLGNGIDAYNGYGTVDLTIDTSAGAVSGGQRGIYARNEGTGDTTITTADVTSGDGSGEGGDGIDASNGLSAGALTINSLAGTVSGDVYGINVSNGGNGALSITTANVSGAGSDGIRTRNFGTDVLIDTTAGTVSGQGNGIRAENEGTGITSVVTGDVTGLTRFGIDASDDGEGTYGTDVIINSTAGSVTGAFGGISADNRGTGDLSITTADVTATNGDGVSAGNFDANAGAISIDTTAGVITGSSDGIDVSNNGSGDTTIITADVNAEGGDGINVENASDSGSIAIDTSAGAVAGNGDGIEASNRGSGSLTIIAGDLTGTGGFGVTTDNFGTDLAIDTTAGSVFGGNEGIDADNDGTGSLTIITADVVGGSDEGIQAFNDGTSLSIDSSLGTVSGQGGGIYGTNGSVFGDNSSIEALSIITADVTGYGEDGIDARNFGTDLTIDSSAGTVSSEREVSDSIPGIESGFGIAAQNYGTGILSITTGDVSSDSTDAIYAANEGADVVIDSTAGSISGASNGIRGVNSGTGSTFVRTANATGAGGDGVNMVTGADTGTLVIDTSAGAVAGGSRGIYANHGGTEDLTITVGNVTGQGAEGILASTSQDTANILIQGGEGIASNVIGATTGIAASTEGADITVTALDSVTGQDGDGLNLVSNGGDITVTDIGTIAGLNGNGIFANSDAGNISVQNVGLVAGITAIGGIGIAAYANDGGTINIGTSGGIGTVLGETYGANGETDGETGDINIDVSAFPVTGAIGINAVNSGDGSTNVTSADVTGTAGEGINASTVGTDVVVNSVAGTVTGLTDGITAANMGIGSTTITTAAVTGTTDDGIDAYNGNDTVDLTIDSTAGAVAGGDDGVYAVNNGSGTTTVTTADVTGTAGDGINVIGRGTDLLLDTSAGTVTGGEDGIAARNEGSGALSITTGDVTGAGDVGIAARNDAAGTDITIDSSAGAVAGASNGVIAQNYGTGSTFVTTADVSTQDSGGSEGDGIGIFVTTGSDGQDLIVDSTAGSVNSAETGIYARGSGAGETSITTADIVSESGNGVFTRADGTDLTIDSSAGSVIGARSGIVATNQGSGALSIVTADVTGDENNGVSGTNEGTDFTINSRAGTVSGESAGVNGINRGSGALTIVSADVDGGTDGIRAFSSGTDLTIDSTAGTVVGDRGIFGQNAGTGVLSITTGDVTADGDAGIAAVNSGTDLVVDSTSGSITSSGVGTYVTGVYARNSGTGEMVITTADISSTNGFGIDAVNSEAGSDLTIDSTAGLVAVGNDGIASTNRGTGVLSIITGDVLSSDGTGIAATNQGGALTINTLAGTVQGAAAGINASNDGSGALVITTANVIGTRGDGVYASSSEAAMAIDTSGGMVTGTDDGIDARNYGTGDLAIVSASAEGTGDAGIKAINTGGATSIDSSAGTVIGTNAGIFADQQNDAALTLLVNEVTGATGIDTKAMNGLTEITLASTAIVMSTQGVAIDAVSTGGDVVVQGSSGTVTGASDGIFVRSGGGDIAIATIDLVEGLAGSALNLASDGGDIDVTGVDAIVGAAGSGILAVAASGNIDIADNGDITGTVAGITASTTGGGDIDITVSGMTMGDAFGVDVSTEGEAVRLTNSGTLSGGTFAVIASGAQTGAITLRNDGTVAQAISFGAANDSFDNRDVFSASGVSDFGDGVDELVNSGSISVFGAAEFQRLEQFNHGGMITLVDGVAGGSLTTSGDFVGNGGTLALDVDFASNSADVLTIGGAATGSTQIVVNPLDLSATFAGDLVLVNAGAGTEAGAFVIATDGAAASPFLAFELAFDAANNDFLFGIALEPKAFEATKLGEGAQALWYRSADAWSDHRSNARSDTKDNHAPAWAVMYGAESQRDESFADPTGLATGGVVLDYTQDFYGIQAGLETWVSDGLMLGLTGGYLNSSLNLEESGAGATFDVLNIGASISFASDGFFGEALIKYDDISGDVSDPLVGGFNGALDGSAFGGRVEFGYRTPGEGFYAEPKVSLEYQRTDLDSLVIAGQRFDFEEFDGLRAGAGVRLGTSSDFGANSRLGLYLDASILHEFEGDGLTRFSSALDDIAFTNDGLDTYGRVEAGVTLEGEGPLSGFFKAETDVGSEFSSFGGSVGVRIRF